MEGRKTMKAVMLLLVAMGMVAQKSSASFQDCYTKCFVFCMIEPTQTLCTCTTHCFKDCIFQQTQNDVAREGDDPDNNLGFCKLGCAFSMCSALSTKHSPNGAKVDSCVGSCSNKCTKTYSSLP